jgi:hypothetical protein
VLDVPLPAPNSVDDSGIIIDDGDAWFDMWVSLAEEVIEKMHGKHGFLFDKDQALDRMRSGIRRLGRASRPFSPVQCMHSSTVWTSYKRCSGLGW